MKGKVLEKVVLKEGQPGFRGSFLSKRNSPCFAIHFHSNRKERFQKNWS